MIDNDFAELSGLGLKEKQKAIIELMDALPEDDDRAEIIYFYCAVCGKPQNRKKTEIDCKCYKDES